MFVAIRDENMQRCGDLYLCYKKGSYTRYFTVLPANFYHYHLEAQDLHHVAAETLTVE